jgi:putative FmdB family regulatory protein
MGDGSKGIAPGGWGLGAGAETRTAAWVAGLGASRSSTPLLDNPLDIVILQCRYDEDDRSVRGGPYTPRGIVPAYDYTCEDCGTQFEVRMSIAAYSAGEKPVCEACGSPHVERAFTTVNVLTAGRTSGGSGRSASCGPSAFT